jgi:SNF2 family DNA or RNA helicase
MNYLDLLDNKPVALPKKTVNVKLPPQNIASKLALNLNPDAEKALSVKIIDTRAENQDTVDRDQLQTLFLRNNITKVLPIDMSKAAPVTVEPPPVVVVAPKAVKLPKKLSMIPEGEEDTDFTAAVPKPAVAAAAAALEERTTVAPAVELGAAAATADELVPSKKRILKQKLVTAERVDFDVDPSMKIGNATLGKRLKPSRPPVNLRVSNYYMNNREIFVNFINNLFNPYKVALLDDTSNITCENIGKSSGDFDLLTHQKLVRDYLNLYTPYRGLLLFHGLGSGKTCTSIAIAEGMKTMRDVVIMTPASLRTNYMEELKKCGDYLYRRQQFWEWVPTAGQSDIENTLHKVLNLPLENIRTNGGAWLVNASKASNFERLSNNQQKSVNAQINLMIAQKYQFINYNGLNRRIVEALTKNHTHNMFDNKVVIIDEAHNFISRIVTKLNMMYANKENAQGVNISEPVPEHYLFHKPSSKAAGAKTRNESEPKPRYKYTSISLYDYLLNAKNAKIVLLTGTPIINYPNEIAILYNILRGYIKTFSMPIRVETDRPINQDTLQEIFRDEQILDTIDYTTRKGIKEKQLVITRNPFGFFNAYKNGEYSGVNTPIPFGSSEGIIVPGQVSDTQFIEEIKRILKRNDVEFNLHDVKVSYHKALPDKSYEFAETFMDANYEIDVHKMDKFSRRIIGLTSYFRSAQEELMPRYNDKFEPVYVEMSDFQFDVYEDVRHKEREKEEKSIKSLAKNKHGDETMMQSSTFKIFSRMACNFVMPSPPGRPLPGVIRSVIGAKIFGPKGNKAATAAVEAVDDDLAQDAPIVAKTNVLDKEAKAQAKALEKEAKALAKQEKADALAQAKEEKAQAKALEKEEKAQAKAAAKAAMPRKTKKKSLTPPSIKDGAVQKPKSKTKKLRIVGNVEEEEKALEKDVAQLERVGGAKEGALESGASGENAYAAFFEKIAQQQFNNEDDMENDDDEDNDANMMLLEKSVRKEYEESMERALNTLRAQKELYLSLNGLQMYSPKFLRMIETINDPEKVGLHLVYSQFRTLEGIGIFAIALEANGFARFKIKRQSLTWAIDMTDEDWSKEHYALYTGTEDTEEKEIIRNIYNGDWDKVPDTIASVLRQKNHNNNLGEIIKVFMITASGSEGINLRNTRHVHIMEPYWNPVRAEQVIGRARRICSHQGLPLELQTVEVFLYLMKFSESQLLRASRSLKLHDVSKADARVVFTTEQTLYEISMHKKSISDIIVRSIKETSIDCAIHVKGNSKENIQCINFGSPNNKEVSFYPNIEHDSDIAHSEQTNVAAKQQMGQKQTLWRSRIVGINGIKYVQKFDTNEIYDYDSYVATLENQKLAEPKLGIAPILVGHLAQKKGKTMFIKIGEAV